MGLQRLVAGPPRVTTCGRVPSNDRRHGSSRPNIPPPQRSNKEGIVNRTGVIAGVGATGLAEPTQVRPVRGAPQQVISEDTLNMLLSFYRSQHNEYDYWLSSDLIEGQVPAELEGTLFRNGIGQLEIFGKQLTQPFDGDGMVSRFTFTNGQVHFSNRYVRTQGFVDEQCEGKMLYCGAFSTGNPSGKLFNNPFALKVKNVANTGILHWGGKLLALHESGLPHDMDPVSLETHGETNLQDSITGDGPFAAHYRIMHEADGSKRFVTFGSKVSGMDSILSLFEYAEDGTLLYKTVKHQKGAAFAFYHDLAVTEHYYVMIQNPTRLNVRKLLMEYCFGRCGIAECILYDESLPAKVHLIPRPGRGDSAQEQAFDLEPVFSFHHVNAFEQGNQVVLDTIGWDRVSFTMNIDTISPAYYDGGQRSELNRIVLDLQSGSATRRSLSQRCCEFSALNPAYNGRPYSHLYVPASAVDHPVMWGPNQVLMKATFPRGTDQTLAQPAIELWAPGPKCFTQEATFVPRPDATAEDDGWLLLLVNNAVSERTDLCILDAQHISAGPVCTLHLPHHIPPGLHGSWSEAVLGPQPPPQPPRRWNPTFSTIRH